MTIRNFAGLLALALLSAAGVSALTLNSPGVVGLHDSKLTNASIATERAAAQTLLDMLKSSTQGSFDASSGYFQYMTSDTEYVGTLVGGEKVNLDASGWEWGFAKYNGRNAGYVLFYLGGAVAYTIIPQFPASLWTNNPQQYALSHLTVFNRTPTVPDGGLTFILLGASIAALVTLSRRTQRT